MQPESRHLPEFRRLRNRRVPRRVTPDVQANPLPELADNAQDRACLEPPIAGLAALSARLEQRSGLGEGFVPTGIGRYVDDRTSEEISQIAPAGAAASSPRRDAHICTVPQASPGLVQAEQSFSRERTYRAAYGRGR